MSLRHEAAASKRLPRMNKSCTVPFSLIVADNLAHRPPGSAKVPTERHISALKT